MTFISSDNTGMQNILYTINMSLLIITKCCFGFVIQALWLGPDSDDDHIFIYSEGEEEALYWSQKEIYMSDIAPCMSIEKPDGWGMNGFLYLPVCD